MSGLMMSSLPLSRAAGTRKSRLLLAERANQLTHGIATLLSLIGAILLFRSAADTGQEWLTAGCLVFSGAMIATYLASTLSHSFLRGRWKHRFRTLDQIAIFLLIAGSYTPVGVTICRDRGLWQILAAIWGLSLAGIATKLFVTRHLNVPVWFYVIAGLFPLLFLQPILEWFPLDGLLWIAAGGACYVGGTFFLTNDDRSPMHHAVWHLLVMAGSACHFVVMYQYLVPSLS